MDYLRAGLILRPHGVHGELKVLPLSDDMERFRSLTHAYLELVHAYEPVGVSKAEIRGKDVYLSLSGVQDREQAEKLRNVYLCVDRAHARPLPEGEYFISDLVGCEVLDTEGTVHGTLLEVLQTGANDVYVVRGAKTLMIPALKKLLVSVDIQHGRIMLDADVLKEVGLFED